GNNNNSMSTDAEIWIKGSTVTDGGLTVAPEIRLNNLHDKDKPASGRHYIKLSDDWGTLTLVRQHSPARLMSLDGEWRGTVSGASGPAGADTSDSAVMTNAAVGAYAGPARVTYQTPDISGFKVGISSADAGASSKANATDLAIVYTLGAFDGGSVSFGYASSTTAAANPTKSKKSDSQLGVSFSAGKFGGSLVQTTKKATPAMGADDKQTGQELEVNFAASDDLTVVLHMFNAKGESGTINNHKFKSTGFGAKYTIAPGLYTSLGYTTFTTTLGSAAKMKGNGMRIRVHAGF
ncbi:MAG: porin, partial [Candidatus Puniceispirillaceae bacterium]